MPKGTGIVYSNTNLFRAKLYTHVFVTVACVLSTHMYTHVHMGMCTEQQYKEKWRFYIKSSIFISNYMFISLLHNYDNFIYMFISPYTISLYTFVSRHASVAYSNYLNTGMTYFNL